METGEKEHFKNTKRKTYDRKRKQTQQHHTDNQEVIQCTHFGNGLKMRPKFFGPYSEKGKKPCIK